MTEAEYALKQFDQHAGTIPEHIRDGLRFYLTDGVEPGGFCSAVLCNNLKEAAGRADHINGPCLQKIGIFMINGMPNFAQGSPDKFTAWIKSGGLNGRMKDPEADAEDDK